MTKKVTFTKISTGEFVITDENNKFDVVLSGHGYFRNKKDAEETALRAGYLIK